LPHLNYFVEKENCVRKDYDDALLEKTKIITLSEFKEPEDDI
jgi:hypothetical protein